MKYLLCIAVVIVVVATVSSHDFYPGRPGRPAFGCYHNVTSVISRRTPVCYSHNWWGHCSYRWETSYHQVIRKVCCDGWQGYFCNIPICNTTCASGLACTAPETCAETHFCPRVETRLISYKRWWLWRRGTVSYKQVSFMNNRACCAGWTGPFCSEVQVDSIDPSSTTVTPNGASTTTTVTPNGASTTTTVPAIGAKTTTDCPTVCEPGRDCVTNCNDRNPINP